ncbi:DUF4232 domain-containing protein [Embleya sp. NBC_00896]|uniref:DUF4232 domain-containing protein n=1 Tax=Embleya sp. NBC_00896 TaxID=2975961 RepID=UPI00386CAA45|nr:DUF4232 domain-containing protein [Embleya sp. NBC_00896]
MRSLGTLGALALASALVCATAIAPAVGAESTHALPPPCAAQSLGYDAVALPPIASSVVLVTVTNGAATCTVDRFPTVTFGDLDGTARPVPEVGSGARVIGAGKRLYAALRTDDRSGLARYVPTLTVAANPAHSGAVFTASEIGAPTPGIAVDDPITTLWQKSVDDAVAALPS